MNISRRYNELLLASLQRAVGAVGSDELLDIAVGCALAEGWTDEDLRLLTRKSVAQRLMHFEHTGAARRTGSQIDEHRRPSPMYQAARMAARAIPEPPTRELPAPAAAATSMPDPAAIRAMAGNPRFLTQLGELLLSFADDLAENKCR